MLKKLSAFLVIFTIIAVTTVAFAYSNFTDVPQDHWAYDAVKKVAQAGLIEGDQQGNFQGNKTMTRYEFAILIGKALDRYDKADADNKILIDKLAAEFSSELNKMGVRLAKVESKTKIWMSGQTRMRFATTSPAASKKLRGSDNFDFRQRLTFQGDMNDRMSFLGRFATNGGNKFGNIDSTSGSTFNLDLMYINMNKTLGLDQIRLGRQGFVLGNGLISNAWNVDGITLTKTVGKVEFKGWTGNVKPDANLGTGIGDSGNANQISTFQMMTKPTKDSILKAGHYWSDITGTSKDSAGLAGAGTLNTNVGSFVRSQGWDLSYTTKIGKLTLITDYVSTTLEKAVDIPSNPKGWFVELSNRKTAPIMYNAIPLTRMDQVGSDAWMVGYRSIDPGTAPNMGMGFNAITPAYTTSAPYNSSNHATDNVNALFIVYNRTIFKDTLLAFEYQDMKFKYPKLTGLNTKNMDKVFVTKLEFFY